MGPVREGAAVADADGVIDSQDDWPPVPRHRRDAAPGARGNVGVLRAGLGDGRMRPAIAGGDAGDAAAGLRPRRYHDLRHAFRTLAVRVWWLPAVQGYMGHADNQTTMV